jgi:hypothetical protein
MIITNYDASMVNHLTMHFFKPQTPTINTSVFVIVYDALADIQNSNVIQGAQFVFGGEFTNLLLPFWLAFCRAHLNFQGVDFLL